MFGGSRRKIAKKLAKKKRKADEGIVRQRRESFVATLRPAVFNRDVLALKIAGFIQTSVQSKNEVRVAVE